MIKQRSGVHTQRIDTVAKSEQRAVDMCTLDHPLALILCVGRPLRACQVNEVQAAQPQFLSDTSHSALLSDVDLQYCV